MKFICLTLLLVSGITDSRSEQYEVVGPSEPVFAVAGEDVILPCSVKPNISVVDMRVEWFRSDLKDSQLVHLYEDHEDRNTEQIQSYRGRTKLNHQELQRGNASLKLSSVQVSDEGRYKCFIQSESWSDDAAVDVKVEAVGSPPVITVDGFDRSGGLHLQCESEVDKSLSGGAIAGIVIAVIVAVIIIMCIIKRKRKSGTDIPSPY